MDRTKIIIFAVIVVIVIIIFAVVIMNPFKQAPVAPVSLEFWSVFDDSSVYSPLIQEYMALYPSVTINYHKKDISSYEKELVDALAAGRGPDIFSINNTWLPKHKDKMAAAPESLITAKELGEVFVDVVSRDLIDEGKVYALPLSVDSLALFYNKDLLNSAGLTGPPKTWVDFNSAVEKLTKFDFRGNISRAGAALGAAKNINRSTDILAALMLQSGAKMIDDGRSTAAFNQTVSTGEGNFNPGASALSFYINFANPNAKTYTWNSLQHYSIDAFVEGNVAIMLNYSYQLETIRARAPHLNFTAAFLPQISEKSNKTTFANYWAQAVAKKSPNQAAAWQFLVWLSSPGPSRAYLEETKKPAARRDLIDEQKGGADLGIFAEQALYAKSWYEADNLAIEGIFADMIEAAAEGRLSVDDALSRAQTQVTELMR